MLMLNKDIVDNGFKITATVLNRVSSIFLDEGQRLVKYTFSTRFVLGRVLNLDHPKLISMDGNGSESRMDKSTDKGEGRRKPKFTILSRVGRNFELLLDLNGTNMAH